MENTPSLGSIETRLRRALPQFLDLSKISEQATATSLPSLELDRSVIRISRMRNDQLTKMPAFLEVQNWVEVNWNPDRTTQPPAATVTIENRWGQSGDTQLDALTATCKLLLAARSHGTEKVAKCAMEFAAHGMNEVRTFYLLKGKALSNEKSLDDYCTLLPYKEALQKANVVPAMQLSAVNPGWPPESAECVCVLETTSFERRGLGNDGFERRESRLLQCGPETLALILGLVWGTGFRVFGNWYDVEESVAATLPFFSHTASIGSGVWPILINLPDFMRKSTERPLNREELADLIAKFARLPKKTQRVFDLAMRRLRDGSERIEIEDKVIDICIALEVLFVEGEQWKHKKIISRRGSWYFADSHHEREQYRTLLKRFYDDRSDIVHGKFSENLTPNEEQQKRKQLSILTANIANLARASLKDMISEGRPQNWEDSTDPTSIRHDPPRAETDIPSVKSESLSWSIAEQKMIDQALEAVWMPEVERAPQRPHDAVSVVYHGVDAEKVKRCRQQGIHYVIMVPIRLYMAHPKWPKRDGDPIDERIMYYCEKDVERHLNRWRMAASKKRIHQFTVSLDEPSMYLPDRYDKWRKFLKQRGVGLP